MPVTARGRVFPPLTVFLFAALTAPAGAVEPVLGELPAGAVGVFEVRDVGAEVCYRQVFPAEAVAAEDLPPGYRLAKLSERAGAAWVAALLRERPDLADRAFGSFCFIEAGMHVVDGAPLYPGRRSEVAFLWADITPAGEAPAADPRFVGAPHRAQIFWLYDEEGVDRDLALKATPDALFGRITVEKSGEAWRVGIESGDGVLSAEVRPTSERRPIGAPTPGFETVLLTGGARDHFAVVTYAGHHEQLAAGEWRATGNTGWARTFTEETVDAGSFIQDGFAARVGLYRYGEP